MLRRLYHKLPEELRLLVRHLYKARDPYRWKRVRAILQRMGRECSVDLPACLMSTRHRSRQCCLRHLREVLFKTADILEQANVEFYLCTGTLLGAVVFGDLKPWDHDVDIYIYESDRERVFTLRELFTASGLVFDGVSHFGDKHDDALIINLSDRNRTHLDIYFVKQTSPEIVELTPVGVQMPANIFSGTTTMTVAGRIFNVSASYESMLTFFYGYGWRERTLSHKRSYNKMYARYHDSKTQLPSPLFNVGVDLSCVKE